MHRLRRSVATVVTVALVTVVTVATAEIAMTFGYDALFPHSIYTYDPEMGFRVRPYARWGDDRANEFGFNDRDHTHAKPPGIVRVLVISDSYNWAGHRDGNYTALLQRKLAERPGPRPIEVINAGYPGTHPAEELIALRRYGLQYDPDVVVLGVFVGNDFIDADPWRRVLPIGGVLTPVDLRTDLVATIRGRPLVWRSHLVRLIGAAIATYRRTYGERPAGLGVPDETYWAIERDHMRVADPAQAGALAGNERHVFGAIGAMQQLLNARRARFVVAAYPDEFQVDEALRRRIVERYGLDPAAFDWTRPQRRLADLCVSRGIPFIDLLPAFRAADAGGARLYLHNEPHWNDAGNELAASVLLDALAPFTAVDQDPARVQADVGVSDDRGRVWAAR